MAYIWDATKGKPPPSPGAADMYQKMAMAALLGRRTPRDAGEGLDHIGKTILGLASMYAGKKAEGANWAAALAAMQGIHGPPGGGAGATPPPPGPFNTYGGGTPGPTAGPTAGPTTGASGDTGGPYAEAPYNLTFDWASYAAPGSGAASRDNSFTHTQPVLREPVARMISEAPEDIRNNLRVSSAYRDYGLQKHLWEGALARNAGRPELARKKVAPPGRSRHNYGLAFDLRYGSDAAREYAHANAARYGLHFPVPGENWHVEPIAPGGSGRIPLTYRSPASVTTAPTTAPGAGTAAAPPNVVTTPPGVPTLAGGPGAEAPPNLGTGPGAGGTAPGGATPSGLGAGPAPGSYPTYPTTPTFMGRTIDPQAAMTAATSPYVARYPGMASYAKAAWEATQKQMDPARRADFDLRRQRAINADRQWRAGYDENRRQFEAQQRLREREAARKDRAEGRAAEAGERAKREFELNYGGGEIVPKFVMDRAYRLAADYEKHDHVDHYNQSYPHSSLIAKMSEDPQNLTGFSDLALIRSFVKLIEPTSAVMANEIEGVTSTAGVPAQLKLSMRNIVEAGGGKLTPEQRRTLFRIAKDLYKTSYNRFQLRRSAAADQMRGASIPDKLAEPFLRDTNGPALEITVYDESAYAAPPADFAKFLRQVQGRSDLTDKDIADMWVNDMSDEDRRKWMGN